MRRFVWQWFAVSSLLLVIARAEVRPRYGGTLRVLMSDAPSSLDPAEIEAADSVGGRSLISLLFDTLVTVDDAGRAQPALAESWQSTRENQRWEFRLRHGVKFHDGTLLTAEIAAASLRVSYPAWNVAAERNMVVVQHDIPDPDMLAELALPRNAIAKRNQQPVGTGPFQISEWQPGKSIRLVANEECWRGRPFLDQIQVEMGRSYRDQITALDLRKVDLVEVAPEQAHHFSREGRSLASSTPIELLALVFSKDASSAEEKQLRQALGLSIERGSIHSVLLQGGGEPAGSLLPTSISGYGFVFPIKADLQKARQLRSEVRNVPTWSMGYDGTDPLSRLTAERIALNARDAGLSLRPTTAANADLRVERISIVSGVPSVALNELLTRVGLATPKNPVPRNNDGTLDALYALEQATLAGERVIPLFHLPVSYATTPALKDWEIRMDGSLNLERAWLEPPRP